MKITERRIIEIILIAVVLFTVLVLIPMTLSLLTEAELPDGYEYECVKENNSVVISYDLGENDNRTISVPFDKIEISYFILSESNDVSILFRDESRSGVWKASLYQDDNNSESDISWTSREIVVGETIILPSGEKVTLLNFDEKGNPQFSVAAK